MPKTVLRFCGDLGSLGSLKPSNFETHEFPPKAEFCISVSSNGNHKSRYSDDFWDMSEHDFYGFDFGQYRLTKVNLILLKQVIFLHLYHMPLFPGTLRVVSKKLGMLGQLCRYLDKNEIRLDQLYRFPNTAIELSDLYTPGQFERLIRTLQQLFVERDTLGWLIADLNYIDKLKKASKPSVSIQNAYIPPRLWQSVIESAKSVMVDFEEQKKSLEKAWTWIHVSYRQNIESGYYHCNPFRQDCMNESGRSGRVRYVGGSTKFLKEYGIMAALERWFDQKLVSQNSIRILTNYVNLVRDCAFLNILAHSMQRLSEGLSMRSDCFLVDDDPYFGQVAMLTGETTKTDLDSDARWVVPIDLKHTVDILSFISRLRIDNTFMKVGMGIRENPYLMLGSGECWLPRGLNSEEAIIEKTGGFNLNGAIKKYPKVFCPSELKITQEDYNIACSLTPELTQKKWFKVGSQWHFNPHQFRRTLAVNMYSQNVPDSVIQWQMKHRTVQQSYYYGRNHTRLFVNKGVGDFCKKERDKDTVLTMVDVVKNERKDNFLATAYNPVAPEILSLIEEKSYKKLEAAAKKGQISVRPTLLGLCMASSCKYGGVESAIHCAGIDGKAPCKDAVFRKRNSEKLCALKERNEKEMTELDTLAPRYSKLDNENKAIEVFLNATST